MKKITNSQAKALRRKQADSMLSEIDVAKSIGISAQTWRRIRQGDYLTRDTVYVKAMEWLAKDY